MKEETKMWAVAFWAMLAFLWRKAKKFAVNAGMILFIWWTVKNRKRKQIRFAVISCMICAGKAAAYVIFAITWVNVNTGILDIFNEVSHLAKVQLISEYIICGLLTLLLGMQLKIAPQGRGIKIRGDTCEE